MQLVHGFTVPAPIDEVWSALLDPERVALCMPGATLTETNDATFSGTVKVKLGAVSLLYKGAGEFIETDEAARKVVLSASGKDSRGHGTAAATVTIMLTTTGDTTTGSVTTDLDITGKPAQFGQGMITEVGGKILGSFADCLARELGTRTSAPGTNTLGAPTSGTESGTATGTSNNTNRKPPPDAIDLVTHAGGALAKRAVPVVAALALGAVLYQRFRSHQYRSRSRPANQYWRP